MNHKISIISPLYNKIDYIVETVESVLNQTTYDWELIIVDDGSNDGSYEVAEKYTHKYSNVLTIRRSDVNKNIHGANICRNIGAEMAKGEYLLFLDADDLLLENCIEQRLNSIMKVDDRFDLYIFNVGYCKGDPPIVYEKMSPNSSELKNIVKFETCLEHYFLMAFLSFDLIWHTSGAVWSKDFFNKIKGFDTTFERLQDPEIYTRALILNAKVKYLKDSTPYDILHRKDDDRVVWDEDKFVDKQLDGLFKYIIKFLEILNTKNKSKVYIKFLAGYFLEIEKLLYRYERDSMNFENIRVVKDKIHKFYRNDKLKGSITNHVKLINYISKILSNKFLIKFKLKGLIFKLYKKYLLPKYA